MTLENILAKLVAFPVLGGDSNISIIQWIKNYIEDFNIPCTLVPNENGSKASLHCRIGPAVSGGIILSGHTDVVPVKGQLWDSDPFKLTHKNDGKLYGRGTCDMKGFIACCLYLLPELTKANLQTPIYFAFSYDEEVGCLSAPELITHLQNHYKETPKYAIIGEPSLLQPVLGHKGICLFKTTVNGSAGHSSAIRKEVSAVHEAARLVLWLENKMNALADSCRDERFTPPHSSIHVGMIEGGIAPNVIANKVSFSWDVRVIPKQKLETIISDFESYCNTHSKKIQERFPEFKIQTETIHPPVPHFETNIESDIIKLMKKINPEHQKTQTVAYASEAGQFSAAGIESIICGPGSINQAHRANEFVSMEQLSSYVDILKRLVEFCLH